MFFPHFVGDACSERGPSFLSTGLIEALDY
jgi:hypothetical protein